MKNGLLLSVDGTIAVFGSVQVMLKHKEFLKLLRLVKVWWGGGVLRCSDVESRDCIDTRVVVEKSVVVAMCVVV